MNTPNPKTLLRKGTHLKWRLLSLELKDNIVDGIRVGSYYEANLFDPIGRVVMHEPTEIKACDRRGVGATPLAAVTLAIEAPLN